MSSGVVRGGQDQIERSTAPAPPRRESAERLPLLGLLALAMAAFITLLTEIMPAGLLSSISTGMQVSESVAGQFITAFAVGAVISAIPVTAMTRGLRRKPLLLLVGALVDRHLTLVEPLQIGFFVAAVAIWQLGWTATLPIYASAFVWGVSFGGFGAVTQTAIAGLAPNSMEVAQSMCTTAWNSAVALDGVWGGFLLDRAGAASFPIATAAILCLSTIILVVGVNRPLSR